MDEVEIRRAGWVRPEEALKFSNRAAIEAAGWIRQGRREHTLRSTPRVGQVFWVDFPHDAYAPEFVGEHPGVIVRAANSMRDPVILVPLTHSIDVHNPHAYRLQKNPDRTDTRDAYAICSHLYTLALGRLRRFEQKGFQRDVFLSPDDQTEIFTRIQRVLARVFAAPTPVIPPPARPRPRGPNTLSLNKRSAD